MTKTFFGHCFPEEEFKSIQKNRVNHGWKKSVQTFLRGSTFHYLHKNALRVSVSLIVNNSVSDYAMETLGSLSI